MRAEATKSEIQLRIYRLKAETLERDRNHRRDPDDSPQYYN